MSVLGLGYIGVAATDAEAWRPFATAFLGMQRVDAGGGAAAYRVDECGRRVIVVPGRHDGGAFYGWEVADAQALDETAAAVEAQGAAVASSTGAERALRGVAGMAHCLDPAGHRVELFHGLDPAGGAFAPGRAIGGFHTGALGLGHVLLQAENAARCAEFYRGALGFRLSDKRGKPFPAIFLHCNARHHSLALFGRGAARLHHLMVELNSIDDVGRAYDMALAEDGRVALTLGRHPNDLMVSFYVNTPSGFLVEYGWGGRLVDDATWRAGETPLHSLWGHKRPGETRIAGGLAAR